MGNIPAVLDRLRNAGSAAGRAGLGKTLAAEFASSGVNFAALGSTYEQRWLQALKELQECVKPLGQGEGATSSVPVLNEGGPLRDVVRIHGHGQY